MGTHQANTGGGLWPCNFLPLSLKKCITRTGCLRSFHKWEDFLVSVSWYKESSVTLFSHTENNYLLIQDTQEAGAYQEG